MRYDVSKMTEKEEYIKDLNQLKQESVSDLDELLKFSKDLLSAANFRHFIKAKTIVRYNTFSAMYQRADAVLAMTKANQGSVSNVIVRSMWETLVEYDFINLTRSNLNAEIRLVNESQQQLTTWRDVQKLRAAYPNTETWQSTISDKVISETIKRRERELKVFNSRHPHVNHGAYRSLLERLKAIDTYNLSKDPNFKTLTQFDYRSVYSILSDDAHSTILGNMNNSRIEPKVSLEIRLDAPLYETVRASHIAYKFMVKFLQSFNNKQKLKKGHELRAIRKIDKTHDVRYKKLQDKYGF